MDDHRHSFVRFRLLDAGEETIPTTHDDGSLPVVYEGYLCKECGEPGFPINEAIELLDRR